MDAGDGIEQVLDQIGQLLRVQHELVLNGAADALPELGNHLAALLGQAAGCAGTAQAKNQAQRIGALRQQAMAVGAMLNRRQSDVQRSLESFGRAATQINAMQAGRMYAPAGLMVASLNTRAVGVA